MNQGLSIRVLGPDREEIRAGDELRSQNCGEDTILSLPSASITVSISDAPPSSGFLFSMPNPDDPLESEFEDDDDVNGAPPSWFDRRVSLDEMARQERTGPPRKRAFDQSRTEGHIHQLPKKRKEQSTTTQFHFINPPSLYVSRPHDQPCFDPNVLEVFSDSEEEEIFQPISVSIGKFLRPLPSLIVIPKPAPNFCVHAPKRQGYPQPSRQQSDLTVDNVEMMIDLT
jgi:hypothetical protein